MTSGAFSESHSITGTPTFNWGDVTLLRATWCHYTYLIHCFLFDFSNDYQFSPKGKLHSNIVFGNVWNWMLYTTVTTLCSLTRDQPTPCLTIIFNLPSFTVPKKTSIQVHLNTKFKLYPLQRSSAAWCHNQQEHSPAMTNSRCGDGSAKELLPFSLSQNWYKLHSLLEIIFSNIW